MSYVVERRGVSPAQPDGDSRLSTSKRGSTSVIATLAPQLLHHLLRLLVSRMLLKQID